MKLPLIHSYDFLTRSYRTNAVFSLALLIGGLVTMFIPAIFPPDDMTPDFIQGFSVAAIGIALIQLFLFQLIFPCCYRERPIHPSEMKFLGPLAPEDIITWGSAPEYQQLIQEEKIIEKV